MIKRTYYCMCDKCGTVLKDNFNQYAYQAELKGMVSFVERSGWIIQQQEDGSFKDFCEDCSK